MAIVKLTQENYPDELENKRQTEKVTSIFLDSAFILSQSVNQNSHSIFRRHRYAVVTF